MLDKMKQMMDMKKQADKIKKELDGETVTCSDIRGINIVINGSQMIQSIEIEENVLNRGDKKRLENELLRGVNAAILKSQKVAAKKMQAAMPGGFPGL